MSNVSLLWMMRQMTEVNICLQYKENAFDRHPALRLQVLDPEKTDEVVQRVVGIIRQPTSEKHIIEAVRALHQDVANHYIKDSLRWFWYILEVVPTWQPYFDSRNRPCTRMR